MPSSAAAARQRPFWASSAERAGIERRAQVALDRQRRPNKGCGALATGAYTSLARRARRRGAWAWAGLGSAAQRSAAQHSAGQRSAAQRSAAQRSRDVISCYIIQTGIILYDLGLHWVRCWSSDIECRVEIYAGSRLVPGPSTSRVLLGIPRLGSPWGGMASYASVPLLEADVEDGQGAGSFVS